jgi:DNA-binding SARP family transcriptional activator
MLAMALTRPGRGPEPGCVGAAAEPTVRPELRVRLLGQLSVHVGETPLGPLDSGRAESLLAYLLLHRGVPQPRQRLAFLLWPDSTEAQARTNLRHVLHHLRRALPEDLLDITPRTLAWRVDVPCWIDVAAFQDAVGRDGTHGDLAALREAAAVYRGDLLPGSYDEWLVEVRDDLRRRHLDGLARLGELLEASGELAEAVAVTERLVQDDPLREEAYQRLMRLHDRRGDRARALRTYHACATVLERELGVEPAAATRAAHDALLAPVGDAAADAASSRRSAPALVGRAEERARLTATWRAAREGRASLVLVTGEPGIGKTRLVDALAAWAANAGAVVAEGRAYRAEGALAYGLAVAWLRSLPGRVDRLDPWQRRHLARLLPELAITPPADDGDARPQLFATIAAALVAPAEPLLLIAEDVQWADADSLQFLHYLLRSAPEAPLLVVATARREEAEPHGVLAELVAGLAALDRVDEIELDRLSRAETAALAGALGQPLEEAALDRLFAESDGNPLFAVEALRAGWAGDEHGRGPVSPKVQAVIESRLALLSAPARELSDVAATIGVAFTTELLAGSTDVGEATLIAALDELWRRGIVVERGSQAYDFSHDKLREVAYLAQSPVRRRRHHLAVAAALRTLHADDPGPVSAQLAAHHERGGAVDDAIAWYERAAVDAQRAHASRQAVRLLTRGLHLVVTLPPSRQLDERERSMQMALLAPLATVEGYGSNRLADVHRRALALTASLGEEPAPPLLGSMALAAFSMRDFAAARRFGEQLRAHSERYADDALRVESDYVLGVSAFFRGELRDAERHFEAVVADDRAAFRPTHLARYGLDPHVVCLSRLGNTRWFLGDTPGAVEARDAALQLAAQVGHAPSIGGARWFAAQLSLELGDEDGVRARAAELEEWSRHHEWRAIDLSKEALLGYVDVLDGHYERGQARIQRAVEQARPSDHAPGMHMIIVRLLLAACAITGDTPTGLAAAEEALAPESEVRLWEAEARRARAVFLAALGAPADDVDAELRRALRVAHEQGSVALERRIAATIAG